MNFTIRNYATLWLMFITLTIVIYHLTDARSGKMRRRKLRKENSPRFFLVSNSKRKDYYNNTNGAEIISSTYFDHEFELGYRIALVCIAKGDPLPRITWSKDGNELVAHPFARVIEWRLNETLIKSKLEIDPTRQMDAGTYECHANNPFALDRRIFKADF
ncbi:Immunoglobulin domain-containing protein oig-4, partial [Fragariocoptes setiger]